MKAILVIGPPPKSQGGIGMMMSLLQGTSSRYSSLTFIDSGVSGKGRFGTFWRSLYYLKRERASYDLVHFNVASRGSTYRKLIYAHVLHMLKKPYVIHLHGGGYPEFIRRISHPLGMMIRKFFAKARVVVVLGDKWFDFVTHELNIDPANVAILPNAAYGPGVPPTKPDENIILFVGRMTAAKGAADLLLAVANATDIVEWKLVLVGDQPDELVSARLSDASSKVEYRGWVDGPEIARLMSEAKIFALPSHAEGLPLSMLEAMAYGTVPVVTPVGSIPEVITDQENGVIVPVSSPSALETALFETLQNDEKMERLAKNARATWQKRYSMGNYRAVLDSIYAKALTIGDEKEELDCGR